MNMSWELFVALCILGAAVVSAFGKLPVWAPVIGLALYVTWKAWS